MKSNSLKSIDQNTRKEKTPGATKSFMQKLSRGLMLPIAILPIAGLFLGLGAGVENIMNAAGMTEAASPGAYVFPNIIKTIGDVIFANLPALFAIAIAIAFTEDAGVAALSAFVGWIVFNAVHSAVMQSTGANSYDILWYEDISASIVTSNVGITSLSTSVFGGMAVGGFVAYIYNKFNDFKMPNWLGFFSGTKSVPIITFLTIPALSFLFLMVWPLIGIGLEKMGQSISNAPASLDALAFGYVERILIPFGLHHVFYTPLWFTTAGGAIYSESGEVLAAGNNTMWFAMQSMGINFNDTSGTAVSVVGVADGADVVALTVSTPTVLNGISVGVNDTVYITAGVNPGSYMQGKYPFMIFGLPAAALAMIHAAKKENRQVAMSVVGAAAITVFLTGITEPLEFTFLFLSPMLFFVFHAGMAAVSFWTLDLLGASVGMTFSGGVIDLAIYGILPDVTGQGADHYWVYLVGAIYAPIYYFTFRYVIEKKDLATPGRGMEDDMVKLFSKKEYNIIKDEKKRAKTGKNKSSVDPARVEELVLNLGGIKNLKNISSCASRLRLTVVDRKKVNDKAIVSMGAAAVAGKGTAIQIIFGFESDLLKTELIRARKFLEENPTKKTPTKKVASTKKVATKKTTTKKPAVKK